MRKRLQVAVMAGMLGFAMLFGGNIKQVQAVSKTTITNNYKKFARSQNANDYWKCVYKIVDVDKNGTPELLIYNTSAWKNEVYSYNHKTKKRVKLISDDFGKWGNDGSAIAYNTSKAMVRTSHADTGGTLIKFYKIKGLKKTKVQSFEYRNLKWDPKRKSSSYYVNGKKVSKKTYDSKYKSMNKGFKNTK